MKKLTAPLFLIAAFALLFAGCGSTTTMVGLKAELTSVRRASDGTTHASWRVVNPNIVPYLIAETNHKIYLNDILVGTVRNREAVGVPANTTIEGTAVMAVAGAGAEQVITAAIAAGSASYRTEATIVIRLYGDSLDKTTLVTSGTVPVTTK
jgi:LEA14-like dessication related protein